MSYFSGNATSQAIETNRDKFSFWIKGKQFDKQPLLWMPGQTLVVRVGDYFDEIQSIVEEKLSFTKVTRVAIRRLQFYFVHGMRWNDLVGFGVPDPNHPGQFTNMDRNAYFPGEPRNDWPPPTQQVEPRRRRSE
jgi:hypothetical protein